MNGTNDTGRIADDAIKSGKIPPGVIEAGDVLEDLRNEEPYAVEQVILHALAEFSMGLAPMGMDEARRWLSIYLNQVAAGRSPVDPQVRIDQVDEQMALGWYTFVQDRLAEELRATYPTTDGESGMGSYSEQYLAVQGTYRDLVDALHEDDEPRARRQLADLKRRARPWASHPDHPGAKQ